MAADAAPAATIELEVVLVVLPADKRNQGRSRQYHPPVPEAPPATRGPLARITNIDSSTDLAGPFATMVLGDLGADVV